MRLLCEISLEKQVPLLEIPSLMETPLLTEDVIRAQRGQVTWSRSHSRFSGSAHWCQIQGSQSPHWPPLLNKGKIEEHPASKVDLLPHWGKGKAVRTGTYEDTKPPPLWRITGHKESPVWQPPATCGCWAPGRDLTQTRSFCKSELHTGFQRLSMEKGYKRSHSFYADCTLKW